MVTLEYIYKDICANWYEFQLNVTDLTEYCIQGFSDQVPLLLITQTIKYLQSYHWEITFMICLYLFHQSDFFFFFTKFDKIQI